MIKKTRLLRINMTHDISLFNSDVVNTNVNSIYDNNIFFLQNEKYDLKLIEKHIITH